MTDWRGRARVLAAQLTSDNALGPAWRPAFEQVPRHVFVPRFYDEEDRQVADGDPEYLDTVYSDTPLGTQYAKAPGADLLLPTSSSTLPGLMARMLGMLDVADGHRVAEIGTGTGYNAALLCHRIGDVNVASIDIDPDLVDAARARLAGLGWHPYLTAGDGRTGIPGRAPYHRIIATCAIPAVPVEWITQLTPDGIIVADLRGELASTLVVLAKTGVDTVEGRFTPTPGYFMWLRARTDNPLRDGGEYRATYGGPNTQELRTRLDPALLDDPDFRFFLQLCDPDITGVSHSSEVDGPYLFLTARDGSWARADITAPGGDNLTVSQTGEHRIWDQIEAATAHWSQLGRPARDRFGLTATTSGAHHHWLDTPDTVVHRSVPG